MTGARRAAAAALCAVASGLAAPAHAQQEEVEPLASTPALTRAGLIDARTHARSIRLDVRYATRNNFTGRRLAGYCRPWAFLTRRAAVRLARVQRALAPAGLGLVVYDGYRPARATRAMVRWAERTGNEWVLRQGYVARRSHHALGSTVDVGLVRLASGRALDMGTAYDTFSRRSHTLNASGRALRNRWRLRSAMARQGFVNYRREWWHYELADPAARRHDITLGCG
jgi:D-alanyl-D-alanine dipeptidase